MANLDKFHALDEIKQNEIINAGLFVFGNSGYKKAYISEIAECAGISKSMVFYYFGSKKELYLYLLEVVFHEIADPFDRGEIFVEKDFFKRIIWATEIKTKPLKKRPRILKFLTSFYFDTDPEIQEEKAEYMKRSQAMQSRFGLEDIDYSKFKDSVDVKLLMKIILRWTEGYISVLQNLEIYKTVEEMEKFFDDMLIEFYETFEMMRQNFYKQEYL